MLRKCLVDGCRRTGRVEDCFRKALVNYVRWSGFAEGPHGQVSFKLVSWSRSRGTGLVEGFRGQVSRKGLANESR